MTASESEALLGLLSLVCLLLCAKPFKQRPAGETMSNSSQPKVVVFDCDGVLVDAVSSWRTLHDSFGTDNAANLNRFIRGELSDVEFMRSDIQMWKGVRNPIHKDELFRAYAGVKLMPGARETVKRLQDEGVFVAIVSAGVDLFVSSIAGMLKVDDWIANGFVFDDSGFLTDEGVCRLHATGKGDVITKLLTMNGFDAADCVSVGDSEMDLSMQIDGSRFIGFNPSRQSSKDAFADAGVPVVEKKDLCEILPLMGFHSKEN